MTGLWARLFGRRAALSPAQAWMARRNRATPEEVIQEHFAASVAHDLDWLLATLAPERSRLYNGAHTIDKRRQTIADARILAIEPAAIMMPLPDFIEGRYPLVRAFKVSYELKLVEPEKRRDSTLKEGAGWSYFVLVAAESGAPWLIADWGR